MFAVVLVGGFGTRLRPLTNDIPKPLLPLGQRTILECLMSQLARGGVTDAVLALGFKPEPFLAAFPDARCAGVRLHYAIESSPLDTAGAIGFAARSVGLHDSNGAFVVANGDIVTDLSIAALIAQHHANARRGALATIHLTPVEDPSQYGVVQFDSGGASGNKSGNKVRGFVEKPAPGTVASRHVNAGTYVFESAVLRQLPGDAPLSVERVTFPALASSGELFAYPTDDYWLDAGRPDTWWDGRPFDAILLDAPCTASGIVRRHPDVRWLRRESDIAQLAAQQARLLAALWPLLRPGGCLLYCTCSVFKAEGEEGVQAFLAHNTDALREPAPGHLLPQNGWIDGRVPDNGGSDQDGFFHALLRKRALALDPVRAAVAEAAPLGDSPPGRVDAAAGGDAVAGPGPR